MHQGSKNHTSDKTSVCSSGGCQGRCVFHEAPLRLSDIGDRNAITPVYCEYTKFHLLVCCKFEEKCLKLFQQYVVVI